jgi:hypothetical protein
MHLPIEKGTNGSTENNNKINKIEKQAAGNTSTTATASLLILPTALTSSHQSCKYAPYILCMRAIDLFNSTPSHKHQ